MTGKFIVALRRADRALVGAFMLVVVIGAAAAINQHTDYLSADELARRSSSVVNIDIAPPPSVRVAAVRHRVASAPAIRNAVFYAPVVTPVFRPLAPTPMELALARFLAEQRCLAEAMYYEARGEGADGEMAIAEVVFHRMRSSGYPHSVCGVVFQGMDSGHGCQFSFACNGEMQRPKTVRAWWRARFLAGRILAGLVHLGDVTGDAISFHAVDVQPEWSDHLIRTIQIGNHIFYRAASRGTGAS
jgi:hypothetical protein